MSINQPSIFSVTYILIILLVILTVFVIILALAFFRKSRENRQLYEQILATNKGLEQLVDARTQELRQAGSAISESIDYASRLQRNLLPPKHILEKHLGHVAVIWQPKDVVGGDFHWFGQIGNQHVLVAMDCTGHGVPGAFMTIIAHSALEQISSSQNASADMGKPDLTAAEILHMLHDSVYRQLHQSQLNRNQNGLDASVVILSGDAKRLNFAGAHMDIYSVPPHAPAVRYKGNKISLGYESADLPELDNIYFDISGEQIFALTTDGILSQPGTGKSIGFGYQRFINTLNSAETTSPASMAKYIMRQLRAWQGKEIRRDDIMLILFQPRS
jgi:serine phosphatase RsbU (regulator of sigma subunit)